MAKIINGSSLALALANYLCTNAYLNDTAQDVLIMVGNWIDEAQEITVPKWIPVSERLPKGADGKSLCEVVIAYLNDGEVYPQVCVGWLNIDRWYLVVGDDDYYTIWGFEAVTHWMPLPEPPQEE